MTALILSAIPTACIPTLGAAQESAPAVQVPPAEFTITYSASNTYLSAIQLDAQVKARKADGSYAHITRARAGADYHVYDVKTEESRLIATDVKLKAKIHLRPQEQLGAELDPTTKCAERFDREKDQLPEVLVGEETLLGFKTYRLTMTEQDDITTVWLAPELACFPLKWVTDFKGNSPSTSTVMALRVAFGTPDEALFTGPEDTREVDRKDFSNLVRAAWKAARSGP